MQNPEGDYFVGIDCNSEIVSVYAGRWNNPGVSVWNSEPTNPPTSSPTVLPTTKSPTVTSAPVASPPTGDGTQGTDPPVSGPTEPGQVDRPEVSSSSSSMFSVAVGLGVPLVGFLFQVLV